MLKLQIYHAGKAVHSEEWDRPVALGRAGDAEPLYRRVNAGGEWRLPIAAAEDKEMSRRHALVEPTGSGIRVTNLSNGRSITIEHEYGGVSDRIGAGESCQRQALPLVIRLGKSPTRVRVSEADEVAFKPLGGEPMTIDGTGDAISLATVDPAILPVSRFEYSIRALQSVATLLRLAMTSEDFSAPVAQAVVDIIGLDRCMVLARRGDAWEPQAEAKPHHPLRNTPGSPSSTVLKRITEEKVTLWGSRGQVAPTSESLTDVEAIVVAPILDHHGEVTGALYTDRCHEAGTSEVRSIAEIEAKLVELIAQAVTVGLQRTEKDRAILAERARFEQFFTPELARILPERPEMLAAKEAEITVLFCDIRGFSRISERLGAARQELEWINDVMGEFSECVRRHEGVLVDYIGDELMAMWGAPKEQTDHARRASLAARDMLNCLPALKERWTRILGEPMDLGIGINSGRANVGNTGSNSKFKYGPMGNNVNLASRVQGATRYLKARLLITGATRAGLGDIFAARKLCSVRVVNIAEPVVVYELAPDEGDPWPILKQEYETAYEQFLNRDFEAAAGTLGRLLMSHRTDGPSRVLLSRAVQWMNAEPADVQEFDEVWNLPGK
jgi:adenylate cyclase